MIHQRYYPEDEELWSTLRFLACPTAHSLSTQFSSQSFASPLSRQLWRKLFSLVLVGFYRLRRNESAD
jgi:hypothetical protein